MAQQLMRSESAPKAKPPVLIKGGLVEGPMSQLPANGDYFFVTVSGPREDSRLRTGAAHRLGESPIYSATTTRVVEASDLDTGVSSPADAERTRGISSIF